MQQANKQTNKQTNKYCGGVNPLGGTRASNAHALLLSKFRRVYRDGDPLKPLSKRRVDVVFKIEPDIIKQIYDFYGFFGKSLKNPISDARFGA